MKYRKSIHLLIVAIAALVCVACEGSKTYRGNWKAMGVGGEKIEIKFEAKRLVITYSTGTKAYKYTQNAVSINNTEETFGIQLSNGQYFQIYFPNMKQANAGLIKDGNGKWTYTISRKAYTTYDDIIKRK